MIRIYLLSLCFVFYGSLNAQDILINEVCASSRASFVDDYGEFEDWIEIYNPAKNEIDIGGWYISDDPDNLKKWRIHTHEPKMTTISPGGYLTLWADKDTLQGALHVNLSLSRNGEELLLSQEVENRVYIIDRVVYPKLKADCSFGRCPDSESGWSLLNTPSPGQSNECWKKLTPIYIPHPEPPGENEPFVLPLITFQSSDPVINELVARNTKGIKDELGDDDDWIEIHNPGLAAINLAGWYISDTLDLTSFYRIPSFDLTKTILPAGGYLILWADSEPAEGVLHMPFKLDNEGESVYLARMVNNSLVIVDQVVFPSLEKDVPYGRIPNASGSFKRLSDPTPMASNLPTRIVNGFMVNELMAVQGSGFLDELGEEEDWIEFYNPTNAPIDLGGIYITDSLDDHTKFRIPIYAPDSTTIQPGKHMVFFADNDANQGIRHLGLKLKGGGERIAIYQPDGEIRVLELRYPYQAADASYGRYPDGSNQWIHTIATPGSSNRYDFEVVDGIKINEFLADNQSGITDKLGQFEDWIEFYNSNAFPVNLGGLYVTDSLNDKLKFRIPNTYPDSTTIPAKGFLVFWADNDPNEGVRHLDIRLTTEGEQVGLSQYRNSSVLMDSYTFGLQQPDISTGRYPDGTDSWVVMTNPTPGQSNTGTVVEKTTGIYINEFMARNLTNFPDEFGVYTDWIEVYNDNNYPVDLGGKYFTNILVTPDMSRIPSTHPGLTTIPAKGFLILRADLNPTLGPLHLAFTLKGNGDQIGLFELLNGSYSSIDEISYATQEADVSFGREVDGGSQWRSFSAPTPGRSNGSQVGPIQGLMINEFMARNTMTYVDETGAYEDWIELYNSTNTPVDITGLYLTDRFDTPFANLIPISATENLIIAPKGYLILWADAKPELGSKHLNFQLAGAGENLGLVQKYQGNAVFLDSLTYPVQTADVSYGRLGDAGRYWAYFRTSSPNAANSSTGMDLLSQEDPVSLLPNPFHQEVYLTMVDPAFQVKSVEVFDLTGQLVLSKAVPELTNNRIQIFGGNELSQFPKQGIYLIKVSGQDRVIIKKMIRVE